MQNLENLEVFETLITQKSTEMPEGPFCQIFNVRILIYNFL